MRPIKEILEKKIPNDFEVEFLHPTITSIEILREVLRGKNILQVASSNGIGFSLAFRDMILQTMSEELNVDYGDLSCLCEGLLFDKRSLEKVVADYYGNSLCEEKAKTQTEEKKKGFWIFGKRK